jgi:predicted nucleic acid-binding protein
MRRYLLDTAPLAALLLARPAAVDLITPWMQRHEVATSILAYAEVVEYSKDFADTTHRQFQLHTLLGEVYPYFLTYPILERYADIRRRLRKPHGKGLIGDIDTLIAATALERNLTVVTIDTDFQRVPDLKVILLAPTTMQVRSTP